MSSTAIFTGALSFYCPADITHHMYILYSTPKNKTAADDTGNLIFSLLFSEKMTTFHIIQLSKK